MLVKISIPAGTLGEARRIAGLLEEALVPSPVAVTLFEEPPSGHRIDAYFAEPIEVGTVAGFLQANAVVLARPIESAPVPDLNWVAISQAALPPVAAGRFLVHGSHDRARAGYRLDSIEIEAGLAFGTAHHATTLGCLEAIDRLTRRRRFGRVLDLGCGTGVLSIAAAYALPQAAIIASDIDPEAVRVANVNLAANGVGQRVRAVLAAGLEASALRRRAPYDLVLANIMANSLIVLAPWLAKAMAPGGIAVLSGILVPQQPAVAAAYRATGFDRMAARQLNGWSTLTLRRRNARA